MLRTRPRRTSLIALLTVATLAATTASVHADTPRPVDKDLYTIKPDEKGLFPLYPGPEPGQVQALNWDGSLTGWGPGNFESRHWEDNDYTEVLFTGCTYTGATVTSLMLKLWQEVPYSFDKDLGVNTLTGCFRGPGYTSQGVWNVHVDGGTKRYFTIPALNGSVYTKATVSVSRIHVDTTAAD
ncbi:hypothetical protein GCM10010363_00340 [Streptomyces omiyaensis]|uniref:hypothetical protein n=1 Tax=Streptomyces omiyaensis TaxID=68247 RepID=UPI001675994D|nr:hypothetical protein [Streptomyces omiyaensis]GGY24174.1 hypothetical protein GCM10010363_00340 [Streptomyces omiyaensis]